MNRIRAATVAAFAMSAALAAATAAAQDADEAAAAVQSVVEDAKSRLDLTSEQEALVKPLVEARNRELQDVRDRYADSGSRRARRAMFAEAEPVIENYLARVRTILTEPQYAKWEAYREAARELLKEQYKNDEKPH
jgi:hypothetical protein